MLPTAYNDDLTQDFTIQTLPSRTFRMNHEDTTIRGTVDEIRAVEQAIFLILNTERYAWIIFSWNYGVEWKQLIGMPVDYAKVEVPRRITDALMQDDRILSVGDFSFTLLDKKKLLTRFTVTCIFGPIRTEMEVQL